MPNPLVASGVPIHGPHYENGVKWPQVSGGWGGETPSFAAGLTRFHFADLLIHPWVRSHGARLTVRLSARAVVEGNPAAMKQRCTIQRIQRPVQVSFQVADLAPEFTTIDRRRRNRIIGLMMSPTEKRRVFALELPEVALMAFARGAKLRREREGHM